MYIAYIVTVPDSATLHAIDALLGDLRGLGAADVNYGGRLITSMIPIDRDEEPPVASSSQEYLDGFYDGLATAQTVAELDRLVLSLGWSKGTWEVTS